MRSFSVALSALLVGACCPPKAQTTAATTPPPGSTSTDAEKSGGALATAPSGGAGVKVSCAFEDGWAALVPSSVYRDDEYLMQAAIGLTEEPDFWAGEAGYRWLKPYAAKRCPPTGVVFEVPAGRYHLIAGKANTFDQRGEYKDNGYHREVQVPATSAVLIAPTDLTHTWPCISCPHLYAWDGARFVFQGEILRDVIGRGAARTVRARVPLVVRGGVVRLRIAEERDEVTHLDELVLEIDGHAVAPTAGGGARTLRRGDALDLVFPVDRPDGPVEASVLATGYYVPAWPPR